MLQPFMHILNQRRIVLASGSPRRKTILENVGLSFEVIPSTFEENLDKRLFPHPQDYVAETAKLKGIEVAKRLMKDKRIPDLIICCDTVVTMDEQIYEKPRDKQHAFEILSSFSGRKHTVITGVVLITNDDLKCDSTAREGDLNITSFHEATHVQFTTVNPEILNAYIETGEPMDKAGGYGIHAAGGTLIEGIQGDYFNVMGFPLHRFAKTLSSMLGNSTSSSANS